MNLKCPADGCQKEPTVQHYRDSPQCIPAVRSVGSLASTSQRKNNRGGRPKKVKVPARTPRLFRVALDFAKSAGYGSIGSMNPG